jgi:hypothetical protein
MKNPNPGEGEGAFRVPFTDTACTTVNATTAPSQATEIAQRCPIIAVHWLGLPLTRKPKEVAI